MSMCHTEGFIKSVSIFEDGAKTSKGEGQSRDLLPVRLKIEAAAPYLFESKEEKDGGLPKRKILLVSDCEKCACIYGEDTEFEIKNTDLTALLVAKANHMKVRLAIDENAQPTLSASKLEIL